MQERRGHCSSCFGFVVAATGSATGLGNIWKFPFITHQNGGGAFALLYLFCIALVGLPSLLAEIYLGKHSSQGPERAFRRLFKDSRI